MDGSRLICLKEKLILKQALSRLSPLNKKRNFNKFMKEGWSFFNNDGYGFNSPPNASLSLLMCR